MRIPRRALSLVFILSLLSAPLAADHGSSHTTPCDEPFTVGGGTLGNSPDPALGWDVGSGQCNGSFTVSEDAGFPGGLIELGIRAEQRRVGQVANNGGDYTVQTGFDPGTTNRAWWNFQMSAAYDQDLTTLDELYFDIRTDQGSSVPAMVPFDLLAPCDPADPASPLLVDCFNDRNSDSTLTSFADHWAASQNPFFGWFSVYDPFEEGAWKFTLTARKDGQTVTVGACFHTPNAACALDVDVDLRPGTDSNHINTRSKQLVPLAILSTDSFDACAEIDPDSVTLLGVFPPNANDCTDVDDDGDEDLLLFYRARDLQKPTQEDCDDPNATVEVTGVTSTGQAFVGTDSVRYLGPDCN